MVGLSEMSVRKKEYALDCLQNKAYSMLGNIIVFRTLRFVH